MSNTVKQTGVAKTARNPIKIVPLQQRLRKPEWIRVKSGSGAGYNEVKRLLREHQLHTVCEEASCPNIGECFGKGTATFMILGDVCTRRCPFCDVAHGRPGALDPEEPAHLGETVALLGLRYVVVTSVDRDDLRDGGAEHFARCVAAIRGCSPATRIEILVPDFRGRMQTALELLGREAPDVFNHNLESVPRLYRAVRPGADYAWSLELLRRFKAAQPQVPTKSGLMLGLGESRAEIEEVLRDLREHGCDMLTLGQYLQPTRHHLPVARYACPEEFADLAALARELGFRNVASGPLVRSSYHADRQAAGEAVS